VVERRVTTGGVPFEPLDANVDDAVGGAIIEDRIHGDDCVLRREEVTRLLRPTSVTNPEGVRRAT
jgi:hypothetical protein